MYKNAILKVRNYFKIKFSLQKYVRTNEIPGGSEN